MTLDLREGNPCSLNELKDSIQSIHTVQSKSFRTDFF
jgi:hypothetical protein